MPPRWTGREAAVVIGPEVPRLSTEGPIVLVARPDDVLRIVDPGLLTLDERRRNAALGHPADRAARAAAHLLVRWCAASLTGRAVTSLAVVQHCPGCGSTEHGRPSLAGLPDIHVSLAHTRGAVAAAAGRRPVGVDVERLPIGDVQRVDLAGVLTAAEITRVRSATDPPLAFLRHWVRKECLVKLGLVRLDALSRVELDPSAEQRSPKGRTVARYGGVHVVDWVDDALDAVVAAAGFGPPVVGAFPPADLRPA